MTWGYYYSMFETIYGKFELILPCQSPLIPSFTLSASCSWCLKDYMTIPTGSMYAIYGGFLSHGGTPSFHPFFVGIFHEKITIQCSLGVSPWQVGNPHIPTYRASKTHGEQPSSVQRNTALQRVVLSSIDIYSKGLYMLLPCLGQPEDAVACYVFNLQFVVHRWVPIFAIDKWATWGLVWNCGHCWAKTPTNLWSVSSMMHWFLRRLLTHHLRMRYLWMHPMHKWKTVTVII